MTDIKVFKSNQVGGNVTMIITDQTKIVIDYGEDLPGNEPSEDFSIDWKNENVDAVLFTHYHGDHIGRFTEIPENIPLYMSKASTMVLHNYYGKLGNEVALKRLDNLRNIKILDNKKTVNIKDIRLTPYHVDHSAFDSFMFLVETPCKTILHTGDYRDKGRRGRVLIESKEIPAIVNTINNEIKGEKGCAIDVLITEGTMIDTEMDTREYTELDMQKDLTDLFQEHKHIFLVISSSNADSLLSFYRAAKANGMGFYANEYVLKQLETFEELSRKSDDPYCFSQSWPILKRNNSKNVSKKYQRSFAGQRRHMRNEGFVTVISDKDEDLWKEFEDLDPILIYSMWDGYVDEELGGDAYSASLADFCHKHDARHIHVGGHASPNLIAAVIECTNPMESVIPLHTDNPEGFLELPISDELRRKIKL